MKKQGSLPKKKQAKKAVKPINNNLNGKEQPVFPDLSDAYVLKGNVLHLPDKEQPPAYERKFQNEDELRQLVFKNFGVIFGDFALVVTFEKSTGINFSNGFVADAFIFHFAEMQIPRFYLLKILFSKTRLLQIFYEMTPVFSFLHNPENQNQIVQKVLNQVTKYKELKQKFEAKSTEEILSQLTIAMRNRPSIIFISDNDMEELAPLKQNYPETWGRMTNQIIVKRYAVKNEMMITFQPKFDEITIPEKPLREKESRKDLPKLTEPEHLAKASNVVKEIYGKIKAELLKADKGLEFNSTNYYVSIHKVRKITVIQIKKNSLSIVMLNPIAETQKMIKHNKILLHKDSVQKFWGGECCTVVVEKTEHLGEVIALLKKMVERA